MSFVIKAKETKNGQLFNFKFFLCKGYKMNSRAYNNIGIYL